MRAFDERIFALINGWAGRNAALDAVMSFWADHSPTAFAILLVVLWLTWQLRAQIGAFIAAGSAFLALGIGQILGRAFPRPRPFATPGMQHVHLLIPHVADASFPSDHATLACALTVVLWRLDRRLGAAVMTLTAWLMVARVFIGAHSPSDVLGGGVLGALTALVILRFAARFPLAPLVVWIFTLLQRWRLAARERAPINTILDGLGRA